MMLSPSSQVHASVLGVNRVFPVCKNLRHFIMALVLVCSIFLTSCTSKPDSEFPDVSFPDGTQDTETSDSTSETSEQITESDKPFIRVAAPISSENAKLLALLFTAKRHGLLPEGETGATVSISFLRTLEPEFYIESLQTPSTGATYDMTSSWIRDDVAPDIIFANSLSQFYRNGALLPLSDMLASSPYLAPDHIYTEMLSTCSYDDTLYAIPYAASAEIIFWNNELLTTAGEDFLPFEISLPQMEEITSQVLTLNEVTKSEENNEKQEDAEGDEPSETDMTLSKLVYAFYDPSSLLVTLPYSFDPNSAWFLHNESGFDFESGVFHQTVTSLRSLAATPEFCVETLDEAAREAAFGMMDPRISGRVAAWCGNTQDIVYWTSTLPDIDVSRIPSQQYAGLSPLALTVYPICVSSQTELPKLASEFAAFLALDSDAILLTDRLENREGFLPVVNSDTVWRIVFENKNFGDELLTFKAYMPEAIYNPQTNDQEISNRMNTLLLTYGTKLILPESDMDTVLAEITNAAKK